MPAGVTHYPDPGEQFGAFRVLPRTDGGHIVIDDRREPGDQTVMHFKGKHSLRDAIAAAKMWHVQGHG
jgi:hypothetical protein